MYIISMGKNGASVFIKVNMLLCRTDTNFSFWFIEKVIGVVLENMLDWHISILVNRKKVRYKYNITDFPWNTFLLGGKIVWYNHQHYPHIKNGIEWLKYECPSDIINFRCLLLKADFRIFYFELESLLNKLVKLCSYFFQKIFSDGNAECFIFIKKANLFPSRAFGKKEVSLQWRE